MRERLGELIRVARIGNARTSRLVSAGICSDVLRFSGTDDGVWMNGRNRWTSRQSGND